MTVAQPLIELDASYARAVPRLSVAWSAAPVPARSCWCSTRSSPTSSASTPRRCGPGGGVAAGRPRVAGRGHAGRPGLRGTSSACTSRASATGERCCSGRSSTATAAGATCTSRAPGARRSPAAATERPRWARCCASTYGRGHARARHPDVARARGRRHRRAGGARTAPPGRGALPGRREPPSRGHLRVRRRHRRTRRLRALADHAIARHYPDAAEAENPYLELSAA